MIGNVLVTHNIFVNEPWRNLAAIEMRRLFEDFWLRYHKSLMVCCFTISIPELSATASVAPLGRAIRAVRCSLIDNGIGVTFQLFRLPKFEKSDRGGRFRVFFYADGNLVRSGKKIRELLELEMKTQFQNQLVLITLNEPPSSNKDGAMLVDVNNLQIVFDWFYHYLADSKYLNWGHTIPARRKKRRRTFRKKWFFRKHNVTRKAI